MTGRTTLFGTGRAPTEPTPDRQAAQAWRTFLEALEELAARHAAAQHRPYQGVAARDLAALAIDLAGTGLRPHEVAGCAVAWPPARCVHRAAFDEP
jgi:hypothetical protein